RDNTLPLMRGVPSYEDGRDAHLPRSTGLTFDWAFYNTRQSELYLQYRQRLAQDWFVRFNASGVRSRVDYDFGTFGQTINPRTLLIAAPSAELSPRPDRSTLGSIDVTLTGEVAWFGLREQIAIGADYARTRDRQATEFYGVFGPPLRDVRAYDP